MKDTHKPIGAGFVRGQRDRSSWLLHVVVAIVAIGLSAATVRELTPQPPWAQSGLERNPGYFIAKVPIDYPLCPSWNGRSTSPLTGLHEPGLQVTERESAPIAANRQQNLGVLLPKTARVVAVYCSSATPDSVARECSLDRCAPAITALVSDDLNTLGRSIVFTLINKTRGSKARVHLSVVWRT